MVFMVQRVAHHTLVRITFLSFFNFFPFFFPFETFLTYFFLSLFLLSKSYQEHMACKLKAHSWQLFLEDALANCVIFTLPLLLPRRIYLDKRCAVRTRGVAQWYNICLACLVPWVQFPATTTTRTTTTKTKMAIWQEALLEDFPGWNV